VHGDDLVLLALPGVQQFIGETRSLSDVRAASEIYAGLAETAARACADLGGRLVFPSGSARAEGMPNRVVALFPEGAWTSPAPSGGEESVASHVRSAVEDAWKGWLRLALGAAAGDEPETPEMPVAQWAQSAVASSAVN
jgi:CRISPR-associated protein Cmr2